MRKQKAKKIFLKRKLAKREYEIRNNISNKIKILISKYICVYILKICDLRTNAIFDIFSMIIFSCMHQIGFLSVCRFNIRRLPLKKTFSVSTNFKKTDESGQDETSPIQDLLDNSALGTGPLDEVDETDQWSSSPYPKGSYIKVEQSQALKSLRPKIDPQDTSVIMFPGQGSEYVGMAHDLLRFPAARDIFDAANEILKYDLLKLMLNGPKYKLKETKYSQVAVVVCSLAALEKLKEERPMAIENCMATAGFGVGEITALTFAGVFKFGDAIKLVRTRAEAMELASELTPSGMALVKYGPESKLFKALEKAKEWCSDSGINEPECRVATFLHPHLKIVAGHKEALRYLECNKAFYKFDDVIKLPVKGAFHTNLMLPATSKFRRKLLNISIMEPLISVHSNVDGSYYKNPDHILRQLPKQIYKPIKWEQMLHILYERNQETSFPETVICGPSNSLKEYLHGVNAKAAEFCLNALQFLVEHSSEFKLRSVVPLHEPGAFHTKLMLPAAEVFKKVLHTVEMYQPSASVHSNVDGRYYKNLEHIQKQLPKQIYKPILWEQLVQKIYNRDSKCNLPLTYTCGPSGLKLEQLIAKTNRKAGKCCIPVCM